ncbi:MAG: dihydrolipoyl dehydrogenase [Bacteroidota bacterium]
MSDKSFDVLVIGGGPAGYTAAIRAAQLGMKTGLIERERLGGVCLNWGCIPTKALLRNAEILNMIRRSEEWGITVENVKVDFTAIIGRSRRIADRVSKGVEYLMRKNGIETISGSASMLDSRTVEVRSKGERKKKLRAGHVILATGARPRSVPGITIDRKRIISSSEAMSLPEQPASMLIVGAGAIGVEFAYFYNALGTKVTVVEMMPGILPIEDREIATLLEASLKKQGVDILTGVRVEKVQQSDRGVAVEVSGNDGVRELAADVALMAIGVQGNVEELGLESVGVNIEKNHVVVDGNYRTSVEGVHAIGDVIGPPWLAHVASAEAIRCVEVIAGKNPGPLDYDSVPGCTYCQPQLASVGMTEERAKAEGREIRVGKYPFRPLGKAVAIGETEGMVKLIFDAKYGELLGAHILGPDATELIAELVIAKRLETTGRDLYRTIHAHPTLSEAVMEAAAAAYGEAINI